VRPGQSISLEGYTLTFEGLQPHKEPNRMVLAAPVTVRRGSDDLGVLDPSQNVYPSLDQPVVTPGVREQPWSMLSVALAGRNPLPALAPLLHGANPFEDVYVVLQAVNANMRHPALSTVTLQVLVNPMVGFIWLGGIVMGLGGLFALLPARRRRAAESPAAEPLRLQPEEVTV
jgi:cytochrome c-type biogenesis protein CcmF